MKKYISLGIVAFLLCIIAALYISYPLIFHMTDYANGELVVAWIMNWNIHAMSHGILAQLGGWQAFFNANIFYPYHNTLAYSDLLLTSSILAMPFFVFFHEPMLPSNITFLSSLLFLGFFTYLLVFYITKNFFASLISGLLIIFSPVTLDKRYHLQILAIEWIPLSLLFFLHFITKKKYIFLFLSLFFFIIQAYNSFMAGYFLLFSYAGIIGSYFFLGNKTVRPPLTKKTILFFLLSFLVIVPMVIPYYQVSHQFHFVRDIRETIHLALQPEDLLVTNEFSRLKSLLWFFDVKQYPPTVEIKPGFLGLVFTILTIVSITYFIFKIKIVRIKSGGVKLNHSWGVIAGALLGVGIWGLILSLGPALHIGRHTIHFPFLIPLPYAVAYYLIPGWQGIRDSSRFEMLFVESMAVVIGIVLDQILKKKRNTIKIFVYMLLLIGVVVEYQPFIHYEKAYTFEKFPSVYSWIAKHTSPHAIIAEMPIYNWDNNPFGDNREVLREYFSTLHFRKLISGGSGFSPPPWQNFAKEEFIDFPSITSIRRIQKYGATYLIVHADELDILHAENYKAGNHIVYNSSYVLSALSQNSHLRFIIQKGNAYVYKLK